MTKPTACEHRQAQRTLKAGNRARNYTILRLIGQGGMGASTQAEHRRMGAKWRSNDRPGGPAQHAAALPRFQREVQAADPPEHPNIVTAYDADQGGDYTCSVVSLQYENWHSDLTTTVASSGPSPSTAGDTAA